MKTTERSKIGTEIRSRPAFGSRAAFLEWKSHKARLFSIRRIPRSDRRSPTWRGRRILYVRIANAGILYVAGLEISWRLPFLTEAIWGAAWDAGWRSGFGSGHKTACEMITKGPAPEIGIPEAPARKGSRL